MLNIEDKARQRKTRQDKTKQNKTKQNKTNKNINNLDPLIKFFFSLHGNGDNIRIGREIQCQKLKFSTD